MVTFKLSEIEIQSYYAIRIFVLVHLVLAMGLVAFLDGHNDGISQPGRFAIYLMLMPAAFLSVLLFRAAVCKRVYGYYVLTQNTLAIKRPGKSTQFLRRTNCSGFIPNPWKLVFRGKNVVPLKGTGMGRAYLCELGETVGRTWWPEFHQGPTWDAVIGDGHPARGPHEIRVDFQQVGDRQFPILVHRLSRSAFTLVVLELTFQLFVVIAYSNVLYCSTQLLAAGDTQFNVWNVVMVAIASLVVLFAYVVLWSFFIWRIMREGILGRYILLSQRGMKVLRNGHGWYALRHEDLKDYAPRAGVLRTTNNERLTFALPLSPDGPFTRLIYTSLLYWGIKARKDWDGYTRSLYGETECYSIYECTMILAIFWQLLYPFYDSGTSHQTWVGILYLFSTVTVISFFAFRMYRANSRKNRIPPKRYSPIAATADETRAGQPEHGTI